MKPLQVFIGFDERETVAYHVCADSILQHASDPVSITPLVRSQLPITRARGHLESTDFAFTRFLVPWLVNYEGMAVFMDCDMLVKADVCDLVNYCHDEWAKGRDRAVWVCQHDYTPKTGTKFLGQKQTTYPRKNWSSVMVFNAARCQALIPTYVDMATGQELHRFTWLEDEEIGSLPLEWNWLVGEYPANPDAKILHYTLGGPWFPDTANCDHADEWIQAWQTSMGIQKTEAVRV